MHRAIAGKLRQSPELAGIALDNLRRWRVSAGRSGRYLDAWAEILKGPVEEMLEIREPLSHKPIATAISGCAKRSLTRRALITTAL